MQPMKDRVDPDMLPVLDQLKQVGFDIDLTDIGAARTKIRGVLEALQAATPPIEGVEITVQEAPYADGSYTVPVRVYQPKNKSGTLPGFFWIHGGGYVLNSAEDDDATAAHFALTYNCVVVSVDYRLAPENPFPIPLEDCYTALKWMYDSADALDFDPERIAIGGASAGGGLCAGLAQITRDRGEVPVIYQLLIYPMIDDRNIEQASDPIFDHYVWSRHSNLRGWRAYLGMEPGTPKTPKYAAPLRTDNLEGLPPALILVGDVDLFLEEDLAYATRLIQAGVPTEVHVYPGGVHAFDLLGAMTALGQRCNIERDAVMKAVLHG